MYVNEEEDLEVSPAMKITDLMELYDRRNYILYKFIKENQWEKVPQIITI